METEDKKQANAQPAPAPESGEHNAAETAAPETSPSTDAATALETNDLSPETLEQLQAEAAKAKEHWDRMVRITADFENYKKRVTRERQEASKYAFAPLLEKLLPILDHFDKALAAAQNAPNDSVQAFHDGMVMIHQQLRTALFESGLEEIDALGQPFDHHLHEAVSQLPSTEVPEGHVMEQLRKGYKLRDRLLRPASVVVAKAPDPEAATAPAES